MPQESDFEYRGKMFRRKRYKEGTAFNEGLGDQLDALRPLRDAGLFCVNCRRWQRWKDLSTDYKMDLKAQAFVRRWICNKCGTTIREEFVLPRTESC